MTGIQNNPAVPAEIKSKAKVELAGGVPFISDADLNTALDNAGVSGAAADAIVDENETARLAVLRSSLSVLAIIALIACSPASESQLTNPGRRGPRQQRPNSLSARCRARR
jgi:hypothetical protein